MNKIPTLKFERFLLHQEIEDYLKKLAAAAPGLAEYASIGTSCEGRSIPMVTITDLATGPAADKPASEGKPAPAGKPVSAGKPAPAGKPADKPPASDKPASAPQSAPPKGKPAPPAGKDGK